MAVGFGDRTVDAAETDILMLVARTSGERNAVDTQECVHENSKLRHQKRSERWMEPVRPE